MITETRKTITYEELIDRIADLEAENAKLRAKTDNRKKLSAGDVTWIRRLYGRAKLSQAELAEMYGVNPATISRTVRGIYNA